MDGNTIPGQPFPNWGNDPGAEGSAGAQEAAGVLAGGGEEGVSARAGAVPTSPRGETASLSQLRVLPVGGPALLGGCWHLDHACVVQVRCRARGAGSLTSAPFWSWPRFSCLAGLPRGQRGHLSAGGNRQCEGRPALLGFLGRGPTGRGRGRHARG